MTGINTDVSQNIQPVIPPYRFPGGTAYHNVNTDLPLSQPLMFYLDGSQTFYLPHEDTTDEDNHNRPQSVIKTLTDRRVFQEVAIRQNQAGMMEIPMLFIKYGFKYDMSDVLMHFEGTDSSGADIYSDIGFNPTQAKLGKITWSPEAVIAQSPGYYTNAHLVIETPDRTRVLTTLDFSLNIIGNDVAYPKVLAFYSSEYERALFHVKEMQTSADHQLNYLQNMYAAIIADNLDRVSKTLQAALDDLATNLAAGKNKVDGFVSESKAKLDELNLDLTNSQARMDKLEKQINDDNLVTFDNLAGLVTQGIADGSIQIDVNDPITDPTIKQWIDETYEGFIQGGK